MKGCTTAGAFLCGLFFCIQAISAWEFNCARTEAKTLQKERNGEIVPRNRYGETLLADGDVLEIVSFVGGG